jgi:hypothetical protein
LTCPGRRPIKRQILEKEGGGAKGLPRHSLRRCPGTNIKAPGTFLRSTGTGGGGSKGRCPLLRAPPKKRGALLHEVQPKPRPLFLSPLHVKCNFYVFLRGFTLSKRQLPELGCEPGVKKGAPQSRFI